MKSPLAARPSINDQFFVWVWRRSQEQQVSKMSMAFFLNETDSPRNVL